MVSTNILTEETRIERLRVASIEHWTNELKHAHLIETRFLINQLQKIGFRCLKCGKCCKKKFGDNYVHLFLSEIEAISKNYRIDIEEIVSPYLEDILTDCVSKKFDEMSKSIDSEGFFHVDGWILKRCKSGNCIFLKENKCHIYKSRPSICSTYPFYIYKSKMMYSKCPGIGHNISLKDSYSLASNLISRYISEVKYLILMASRFHTRVVSKSGESKFYENYSKGLIRFIVHNPGKIYEGLIQLNSEKVLITNIY